MDNVKLNMKNGFTLVELIIVVVVMSIVLTVALRSGKQLNETSKIEQTKDELEQLSYGIVGNPELHNNGVRTDFGYVGDVGSLPGNLDALMSNPGGYASWNGPYIKNKTTSSVNDFKTDSWGSAYIYAAGISISSSGSGQIITHSIATSSDHLLYNEVAGDISDLDGTPPGADYKDSISAFLTIPNGSGSLTTLATLPDGGGYFSFDSIPIGNHQLQLIYNPANDTIVRYVSVTPNSDQYNNYNFSQDYWSYTVGPGGLTIVTGSDSTYTHPQCNNISFWIKNISSNQLTANSIMMIWSTPTAYYRFVIWDGITVFDENNAKAGSGEVAPFSAPQIIAPGDSLQIRIEGFKSQPTGGSNVDMSYSQFAVLFSDGSTINVDVGGCN